MSRAALIAKELPTESLLATLGSGALLPPEWNAYRSPQQWVWRTKWTQCFFAGLFEHLLVEWQWTGCFSLNYQGLPEQISVNYLCLFAQSNVAQQQALTQLFTGFISPVCSTLAGAAGHPLALLWSNAALKVCGEWDRTRGLHCCDKTHYGDAPG